MKFQLVQSTILFVLVFFNAPGRAVAGNDHDDLILFNVESGSTVGVNLIETKDDIGLGGDSSSNFSVQNNLLVWEGTVGELADGKPGFCNLETTIITLVPDRDEIPDEYSGISIFVSAPATNFPLKAVIKTTDTPDNAAYLAVLKERNRDESSNVVELYADWGAFALTSRDPSDSGNITPLRLKEEDAEKATSVGISIDEQLGDFRVEISKMLLVEDHSSWWGQYWWVGVIILVVLLGVTIGLVIYCRRRRLARQAVDKTDGSVVIPRAVQYYDGGHGGTKPKMNDNSTVGSEGSSNKSADRV